MILLKAKDKDYQRYVSLRRALATTLVIFFILLWASATMGIVFAVEKKLTGSDVIVTGVRLSLLFFFSLCSFGAAIFLIKESSIGIVNHNSPEIERLRKHNLKMKNDWILNPYKSKNSKNIGITYVTHKGDYLYYWIFFILFCSIGLLGSFAIFLRDELLNVSWEIILNYIELALIPFAAIFAGVCIYQFKKYIKMHKRTIKFAEIYT